MVKLERSEDYFLKQKLLRDGYIPRHTEIQKILGDPLARAYFETCPNYSKLLLGLAPPLEGPKCGLWQSPSDLLLDEIRLKVPPNDDCIKALTHQGILEIGAVIEKKVFSDLEAKKQQALEDCRLGLLKKAARERKKAIYENLLKQKDEFDVVLEILKGEFKKELLKQLHEVQRRSRNENVCELKKLRRNLDVCWEHKLILAVRYTIYELGQRFAEELKNQSDELYDNFQDLLCDQYEKYMEIFRRQKAQNDQEIIQLHKELKCENIANLMQVMVDERQKCESERRAIEKAHTNEIAMLRATIRDAEVRIHQLTKDVEEQEKRVRSKTYALEEIVREFQKFIYYALKAVPTQAEYLLDIERLMLLGLETSKSTRMSCYSDESQPGESVLEETQVLGIVCPDFHDCDNKSEYRSSVHTLNSVQDLPGFVFNDSVYVREDFRNMISQGLRLTKSHELWKQEIEDLVRVIEETDKSKSQIRFSASRLSADHSYSGRMTSITGSSELTSLIVLKKSTPWLKSINMFPVFSKEQILQVGDSAAPLAPHLGDHSLPRIEVTFRNQTEQIGSDISVRERVQLPDPKAKPRHSMLHNSQPPAPPVEEVKLPNVRDSVDIIRNRISKIQIKIPENRRETLKSSNKTDHVTNDEGCDISVKDSIIINKRRLTKVLSIVPSHTRQSIELGIVNPNLNKEDIRNLKSRSRDSLAVYKNRMTNVDSRMNARDSLPTIKIATSQHSPRGSLSNPLVKMSKTSLKRTGRRSTIQSSGQSIQRDEVHTKTVRLSLNTEVCSISSFNLNKPRKNGIIRREPSQETTSGVTQVFKQHLENLTTSSSTPCKKKSETAVQPKSSFASAYTKMRRTKKKETKEMMDNLIERFQKCQKTESNPFDFNRKSVGISHVEIIPSPSMKAVAFNPAIPKVITSEERFADERKISYEMKPIKSITKHDNFLTKPNALRVAGDLTVPEVIETQQEFTEKRIESFIDIFKKHPSLRRLFLR